MLSVAIIPIPLISMPWRFHFIAAWKMLSFNIRKCEPFAASHRLATHLQLYYTGISHIETYFRCTTHWNFSICECCTHTYPKQMPFFAKWILKLFCFFFFLHFGIDDAYARTFVLFPIINESCDTNLSTSNMSCLNKYPCTMQTMRYIRTVESQWYTPKAHTAHASSP